MLQYIKHFCVSPKYLFHGVMLDKLSRKLFHWEDSHVIKFSVRPVAFYMRQHSTSKTDLPASQLHQCFVKSKASSPGDILKT